MDWAKRAADHEQRESGEGGDARIIIKNGGFPGQVKWGFRKRTIFVRVTIEYRLKC